MAVSDPELIAKLADIYLPAPPSMISVYAAGGITALVCVAAAAWWYQHRRRTQTATVTGLDGEFRELERVWRDQRITSRDAAYRLSTLLRRGLGIRRLTQQPPAQCNIVGSDWQRALAALDSLRYQPGTPAHDFDSVHAPLLNQVRDWASRSEGRR